ncbi:uncharacterized protein LOC123200686 isoform X2 [Mangifera indica]|uniref:uncharacterized protein LOC123200686 isoform X2 n=1 Tax=Mangifera indica TaxID=29780 RepID=UPI001CFC09E7|nr:uncharacterized protein LOC123200686 isoform X2 [Mangifera indica]
MLHRYVCLRCWVKISMKMDCLSQQVIETIGIQIMRCLLQLDLSGVDRDKVSGQASAQIRSWKPYNPNPGVQPAGGSIQGPLVVGEGEVGVKLSDPLSDMQKNKEYGDAENVPFLNSSSPSQSNDALPNLNNKACSNMQCMNESTVSDVAANETEQMVIDGFKERSSCLHSEGASNSEIPHLSSIGVKQVICSAKYKNDISGAPTIDSLASIELENLLVRNLDEAANNLENLSINTPDEAAKNMENLSEKSR